MPSEVAMRAHKLCKTFSSLAAAWIRWRILHVGMVLAMLSFATLWPAVASAQAKLSINDVSLDEGNAGVAEFSFTITLDAPAPAGGVTFDLIASDGTADSSDYASGTVQTGVRIEEGQTTYVFEIYAYSDEDYEADETFFVDIANATGAEVEDSRGVGTIRNDETTPAVRAIDQWVVEGDSGVTTAAVEVVLSYPSAGTVIVDYATFDISAREPEDYESRSGTLVFEPGQLRQTVDLRINGDTDDERTETFELGLLNVVGGTNDGGAIVRIVSDDSLSAGIFPATLPDGLLGERYDQGFFLNDGSEAEFTIASGILPPGIQLVLFNNRYYLIGEPTVIGSYEFSVTASRGPLSNGQVIAYRSYSLTVRAPTPVPLVLPPTTFASAPFGSDFYDVPLNPATGGKPPYRYALTGGALPLGLDLSDSGSISGVSQGSGTFEFTVTATDSSPGDGPYSVSRSYTLVAEPPELELGTLFGLEGTAGSAFDEAITVSGGTEPYSVTLSAGRLPTGLSLTADYRISGTPTEAGSFPITLTATDSTQIVPATVSADFVVNIGSPQLSVSSNGLDGLLNAPFSDRIVVEGGIAPYRFSLSGALAPGLRLDPDTGVIDGTPTEVGEFNVSITVVDSTTGTPGTLTSPYRLTIKGPTLQMTPAAGGLRPGTAGVEYRQNFVASGGIGPYRYTIEQGSGLPPQFQFDASGLLIGTPTVAGTYAFSVTAVDETDSGLGPVTQAYYLSILAPEIRVVPPILPNATRAMPYIQQVVASGGTAPYGFSITYGVLPEGLELTRAGVLAGTSTTAGSTLFVVTATDALGFTGGAIYEMRVVEAPLQAIDDTATAIAGTPVTIAVTANDAGAFDAIAIATAPAGGNAVVSGFDVVYTANPDFVGMDTFTYALTGPGGSAQATVTVTVGAIPVARSRSLHAVAGVVMDIDVTEGASGGPFTAATLVTIVPANSGTADIAQVGSGTNARYVMTYFPLPDYAGAAAVTFTLGNGFATSAVATIAFDIAPRPDPPITPPEIAAALGAQTEAEPRVDPSAIASTPTARSREVDTLAGVPVDVELTESATGGPFTAATLVALTPASSGTVSIVQLGREASARYRLTYTPAAGYAGAATATFTLGNGFSTSAVATIAIKVAPRPDPSRDAEPRGLLNAQVESAQRFATTQTSNFQQRMERLHGAGEGKGFSNGLSAATQTYCPQEVGSMPGRRCERRADDIGAAVKPQARRKDSSAAFGVWASGMIRSGNRDGRNGDANVDFETDGVSVGADYRLNDAFAFGGGVGYGRDESDVGDNGSRGEADAFTLALYASYSPGQRWFVDMLLGYQSLGYDLRRHVATNDSIVDGSRDGAQWFGSVSAGADIQRGNWQFTPYARMDLAQGTLDGYSETGDPLYALAYGELDVETTTGNAGLRIDYRRETAWGAFSPQFRLEYQRDFKGNGAQTMQYADAPSGPFYRTGSSDFDRSRLMLGAGLSFSADNDWSFKLDYRGLIGSGGDRDHGLQFEIGTRY